MPWFKVDDGLHSHSKVDDATVAAMGLWVIAGSWASDQLTDGWVPRSRAAKIDPEHWKERSDLLVAAGFWHDEPGCSCVPETSPLHEGKDGWHFHDWQDQQPSRQTILDERRKQAERVAAWRERRRAGRTANGGNAVTPDATHGATDAVTYTRTRGATNGVRTHAPTRPDPTPVPDGTGRVGGRGESKWKPEDDPDFENRVHEQLRERMGNRQPADSETKRAAVTQIRNRLQGKVTDGTGRTEPQPD